MFRSYLIRHYVPNIPFEYIISHSSITFLKPTFFMVIGFLGMYIIFSLLESYITHRGMQWLFVILGLGVLLKYTLDFLNNYLDTLLLYDKGLVFFMREGLFNYKYDFFEWHTIEAVSFTQNSIRDKICNKADLLITLNQVNSFLFRNVHNPQKVVHLIHYCKQKYASTVQDDSLSGQTNDYRVLIEALGEVVYDYVQKKQNPINNTSGTELEQ